MNESRKRMRSNEDDCGVQLKYFVNQKLVDKSDQNLMKGVYAKTLDMMFAGSRNQSHTHQVQPDTRDLLVAPVFDTIDDKLPERQGCKLCWRDIEHSDKLVCKNCTLRVCTQCRFSCYSCSASLCSNCVKIFGCAMDDNPICEDCKFYVKQV